jgi:FMN phosphatase YigB (HAD superfamily)
MGFWAALTAEHLTRAIGDERERMWYEALRLVGIDDRALAARAAQAYVEARASVLALAPGALDVLVALRARGCKLGLVTNGFAATHHDKIDRLGLRELMDAFFRAREAGLYTVLLDVYAIPIPEGARPPDARISSIADVLGLIGSVD